MAKSITYRFISKLGINLSSGEYENITFIGAMRRGLSGYLKAILLKYCMYSVLLSPLNYRLIRPYLWKKMGCKVGKKVFIGYGVWLDYNNTHLIEIGDNVHITNMCLLLCHQRDLSNYFVGENSANLKYKKDKIIIENGVMIGMNSTIMPGVTIGEGSIIGANSLVLCDIAPWTVAAGNPAKVLKSIESKT
jgi:acetyltransferase-like isoleucine patch superfamily enzyme